MPPSDSSASHCFACRRLHYIASLVVVAAASSAVWMAPASFARSLWFGSDLPRTEAAATRAAANATVSPPLSRGAASTVLVPVPTNLNDVESSSSLGYAASVELRKCPRVADIVDCPGTKSRSTASIKCRDCIVGPWVDKFYAANNAASSGDTSNLENRRRRGRNSSSERKKYTYLSLLVPPFFGSSVLSNILSSSPTVTNMCKDPYGGTNIPWQCEPTSTLIREGVFQKMDRWDPDGTNWTEAYEVYLRLQVWTDMDAPVRLDKAPPNFAKARRMVEYFESNDLDYRFVVMMRHPCRKVWSHSRSDKFPTPYSVHLRSIVRYVPQSKRFFINYDDLVTRPGRIMRALLDWFPLLASLSLDSMELGRGQDGRREKEHRGKGRRWLMGAHKGGSLRRYIESDKCRIEMRKDADRVVADEIDLWDEHFTGRNLLY